VAISQSSASITDGVEVACLAHNHACACSVGEIAGHNNRTRRTRVVGKRAIIFWF